MLRWKRACASSAETISRNCSWRAARRTASSSSASRPVDCSFAACRSWKGPQLDRRTGRITFALGRHKDPADGARQRRQGKSSERQGLDAGLACPDRHDLGEPDRRHDLAGQRHSDGWCARAQPVRRAIRRRPTTSQTASAASSRPGSSRTGRDPTAPERRGITRPDAHAVHRHTPDAAERGYGGIVAATAGASDGDDRVAAIAAQHVDQRRRAVGRCAFARRDAALRFDAARDQRRDRIVDAHRPSDWWSRCAAAARGPAPAGSRLRAQPPRRSDACGCPAMRSVRPASASAPAASMPSPGAVDAIASAIAAVTATASGRSTASRPIRQRVARIDPGRRRRQRRRRVGAGIHHQVGAHRPAVAQRNRRAGTWTGTTMSAASTRPAAAATVNGCAARPAGNASTAGVDLMQGRKPRHALRLAEGGSCAICAEGGGHEVKPAP